MADTKVSRIPFYCITQDRCRLCQFKLADDELVYAALDDDDLSCEFPFRRHTTFHDDELDVKVHICLTGECMFRTKPTVCFHSSCHEFRFFTITPAFLTATHYTFAPPDSEERRRARYIHHALARNLQRAAFWPRDLPLELWLMVAGLLAQDCATLTAQEQVHACEDAGDSVLDLGKPVYASYVKVDGRCYVKSLRNTGGTKTGQRTRLVPPPPATQEEAEEDGGKDIFIAEDHLGVRQVFFVSPNRCDEWCRNPPRVPGAWWKYFSRNAISSAVAIRSDGLKIRAVESMQKEPLSPFPPIGWQVPVPSAPAILDLLTLEMPREYPSGLRMRFVDCNRPGIIGYSVATDGVGILTILSHKQGETPDASLYEDVESRICLWIYIPINQGEYLTDICRRAGCLIMWTEVVGMMFSTNQGRSVLVGLYGHENMDLRRIATIPNGPCRMYFNQLDPLAGRYNIEFVAFEKVQPHHATVPNSQDMLPALPISISPYPYSQSNEVRLHSSCTMTHVIEVHPCVNRTTGHRPVIGMLLDYADGHRECVGQFRLDWISESIIVGKADKLYICGKRTKKSVGYVASVMTQAPATGAEGHWLEVAQVGTLEWWISCRRDVLYYNGLRLN